MTAEFYKGSREWKNHIKSYKVCFGSSSNELSKITVTYQETMEYDSKSVEWIRYALLN